MTGIYFSGTGNTKHCTEYLLRLLEEDALTYSIEDKEAVGAIQAADTVVFAYPVYYSNLPKFVYDFIVGHAAVWREKKIMIVATMGVVQRRRRGLCRAAAEEIRRGDFRRRASENA